MDPIITMQKIQAIKKSRSSKKKMFYRLLDRLFFYCLALISCLLLFSSPFWLPEISCSVKSFFFFFFFYIPKMSHSVLNPKLLFILTNVIVIVLIGESKSSGLKLASQTNNSYYEEYVRRSHACDIRSNESEEKTKFEDILEENTEKAEIIAEKGKNKDLIEGDELSSLPTEELNKRADNLIARVNKQRKLEARLLLGYIDS